MMYKKNIKKRNAITTFAILGCCALLSTASVQAMTTKYKTTTKKTSKITVQELEYDLYDTQEAFEIDFLGNVKLKSNVKVTVKDSTGKEYKTSIHEHDKDDLSLDVVGLKAGESYTITIKGIKKSNAKQYGTLVISFSIPNVSNAKVKKVDYDHDDREITFDFDRDVTYKNVKVKITNKDNSKTYSTSILEKDEDELTIHVKGLKQGSSYQYEIKGVNALGTSKSKTLSGTFFAID